jgi:hypothetical protein
VLIFGYGFFLETDNCNVQRPFLVGITIFLPLTRHAPDVTRHVFAPLDGVVTIDESRGLLRTFHDVVFTKNPPIALTDVLDADATLR